MVVQLSCSLCHSGIQLGHLTGATFSSSHLLCRRFHLGASPVATTVPCDIFSSKRHVHSYLSLIKGTCAPNARPCSPFIRHGPQASLLERTHNKKSTEYTSDTLPQSRCHRLTNAWWFKILLLINVYMSYTCPQLTKINRGANNGQKEVAFAEDCDIFFVAACAERFCLSHYCITRI